MSVIQISTDFKVTCGDIFRARTIANQVAATFQQVEDTIFINQGNGFFATFILESSTREQAIQLVDLIKENCSKAMTADSEPIRGSWDPNRIEVYGKACA